MIFVRLAPSFAARLRNGRDSGLRAYRQSITCSVCSFISFLETLWGMRKVHMLALRSFGVSELMDFVRKTEQKIILRI